MGPPRASGSIDSRDVSIRSPHRSEGRSSVARAFLSVDEQSAPPTGVRGDAHRPDLVRFVGLFQSAPPTGVRGDAGCYNQHKNNSLYNRMRDSIKKTSRIADPPVDKLDNLLSDKRFPFARIEWQISVT